MILSHLDTLYRLAYRLTGTPHAAEDLVQSLVTNLLPQAEKLKQIENLKQWLSRSLYNLFIDTTRRQQVSPVDLRISGSDEQILAELSDDTIESPEAFADRCFTHEQIASALQKLTPELRAVAIWHDMEGYKMDEIAEALSIPVGTVKSRLHRSRGMLRELLIERFSPSLRDSK